MNKQQFFELFTDYVAKKHHKIYLEAVNNIHNSHFLTDNDHAREKLEDEARDFLRLFNIEYEV